MMPLTWDQLIANAPRLLAALVAALALAAVVFLIFSSFRVSVNPAAKGRLEQFSGAAGGGLSDRLGRAAIKATGLEVKPWAGHLEWAQLGGYYAGWTPATLIGQMILFGLIGLAAAVITRVPVLMAAAVLLPILPFFQVRAKAKLVQRRVLRAVPEMAALVAAELAAGNAPDRGIERAAELGGEIAALLRRAVSESRSSNQPLFSRPPVAGTLVAVLGGTGLEALNAFARQLDLVAVKGVGGAALMSSIARQLAQDYHAEVLKAAERLENDLIAPSMIFFFLPITAAIMAPLIVAVTAAL